MSHIYFATWTLFHMEHIGFFFKGNDILNAGVFFPLVLWLKKTQGFKLTVQDFDEGHNIE